MIIRLLTTLIPTILIELGVLVLLREKRGKVLWASVGINILTNVPLNIYADNSHPEFKTIIVAELLVIAVETWCYYVITKNVRQSLTYSILCNAVSFLIGLLFCLVVIYFKMK